MSHFTPTKPEPYEPILARLTDPLEQVRIVLRRAPTFEPQRFRPILCTPPMVYGTNGSPRDRMRHQVQMGEGAPAWRGRMPTNRYQIIRRRTEP